MASGTIFLRNDPIFEFPSNKTIYEVINDQPFNTCCVYYKESSVPSDYPSSFTDYKYFMFFEIKKWNATARTSISISAVKSLGGGSYTAGHITGTYLTSFLWSTPVT